VVEGYVDNAPSAADDRTTLYKYDPSGNLLGVRASLPGGAVQETLYVYQARTATGSAVNSNDLLSATQHPDPATGLASTSQQENYTVNALGERTGFTDRNGTTHTYSFDVVGRLTADTITQLGGGVNGLVRRIETAYDTAGRASLFTSFDAQVGGSIVNQVQRDFNGLSQLTSEWQSHAGAVTGTTPRVQYAYSEMASGANHSRLTSMTYPNGQVITFNYTGSENNTISRLSDIVRSGTTVEDIDYLGLATPVRLDHPGGLQLRYIRTTGEPLGEAGDQYTGLDRFGRIVDQRWRDGASVIDRYKYGYDRNGNRLYRDNLENNNFDELYHANGASSGYDLLNRIVEYLCRTKFWSQFFPN
jgi:YD repeat-containing protein